MSYKHAMIAELKSEAKATRKMLERVPLDKSNWKPHEKSMAISRLATHIAELPSWITMTLTTSELDFAKRAYNPATATSTEELLAILDENVDKAVTALENADDEEFDKTWSLRNGEQIFFTLPKKIVLRSSAFNHIYHHRGQLSVYLRLLDVPVPGTYGPTADDAFMMPPPKQAVAG